MITAEAAVRTRCSVNAVLPTAGRAAITISSPGCSRMYPDQGRKSSSQSCSTVLVAGHAGLYQLIVSSMSCDVEQRCSAVPHSFSNRSRRVWAFASVSSGISYPDSWENKPLPSRIVRGNREAASQKIDYPLFKIF